MQAPGERIFPALRLDCRRTNPTSRCDVACVQTSPISFVASVQQRKQETSARRQVVTLPSVEKEYRKQVQCINQAGALFIFFCTIRFIKLEAKSRVLNLTIHDCEQPAKTSVSPRSSSLGTQRARRNGCFRMLDCEFF